LRSGDYLKVEPLLIRHGGPEMTRIHSGRSRQDIGATMRRLFQRDAVLAALEGVESVRASLLTLAAASPAAIVPAYTMGVQAQPISFGHYILAYSEALERDAVRLREAYARINQSPLGSAALGTSSFAINRQRLAELLGFGGVITNSLDASQISPIDAGAELSGIAVSLALTLGTFANDLLAQYRFTTPWLTLEEGALTSVSSIMPQKRNPNALSSARWIASGILGDSVSYYFRAHNTQHGSLDYKGVEPQAALIQARDLSLAMAEIVGQLKFNADRALDEVNADYATTTELADILQREANVPFRVGHHFASELVTFGRQHSLRPTQIDYADAKAIYAEAAKAFDLTDNRLPLDEPTFRRALTAENMVSSSKGLGGPQAAEVASMLMAQTRRLEQDRAWTRAALADLTMATSRLDESFNRLRTMTGK
jgi:argininosuccinate lyase